MSRLFLHPGLAGIPLPGATGLSLAPRPTPGLAIGVRPPGFTLPMAAPGLTCLPVFLLMGRSLRIGDLPPGLYRPGILPPRGLPGVRGSVVVVAVICY